MCNKNVCSIQTFPTSCQLLTNNKQKLGKIVDPVLNHRAYKCERRENSYTLQYYFKAAAASIKKEVLEEQ